MKLFNKILIFVLCAAMAFFIYRHLRVRVKGVEVKYGDKHVVYVDTQHFVGQSSQYLSNIKLDLPEEISTVKQQTDGTVDLLTAYLDTDEGVIHLAFTGRSICRKPIPTPQPEYPPILLDYRSL